MEGDDEEDDFPTNTEPVADGNHVAGAYNPHTRLQHCVICGGVIQDNRNARHMACHPPDPNAGHSHWAEGPVFRAGNMTGVGREESLQDCEYKL